jgi:hypothetical protein
MPHFKTLLTGTKTAAEVETSTSTSLICGAATNGDDDPSPFPNILKDRSVFVLSSQRSTAEMYLGYTDTS